MNDPDDPGGLTKWGISQRAYPALDIRNLTQQEAEAIYYRDYWRPCGAQALEWPLSLIHFDAAVNSGLSRAKRFLKQTRDWKVYLLLRESFYRELARRNPRLMKYVVANNGKRGGWLRRLDYLRKVSTTVS